MCQPRYSRERGKTHFKVKLTAFGVMRYNKIHSIKIIINNYLLCFLGWEIIFFFEKAIRQKKSLVCGYFSTVYGLFGGGVLIHVTGLSSHND